jgi:hypothetical protein
MATKRKSAKRGPKRKAATRKVATRKAATRTRATRKSSRTKSAAGKTTAKSKRRKTGIARARAVAETVKQKTLKGVDVVVDTGERAWQALKSTTSTVVEGVKERIGPESA